MLSHIYTILFCLYYIYAIKVPRISIKPLSPKGLEVSIPHIEGIELFSFGGELNAELNSSETLTISRSLGIHKHNKWTFSDKSIKWKYDDVITYWLYLEYSDGVQTRVFNSTGKQVIVRDFVHDTDITCIRSLTEVNGRTIDCTDTLVFEELFHHFDYTRWEVEKYNPFAGPNFEFNSYERDRVGVKNNTLIIQPTPKLGEGEVRGKLDLRYGCTSVFPEKECFLQHFLLPPVKSGKIVSKATFKYGKIQIRAKLPAGDWIFPEVALVPKDKKNRMTKIWIAYARGNENLQDANGQDIGARLFFCGPTKSMNESERRDNLANRRETFPFTRDYHVYTLFWLPTTIICYVDNIQVGKVSTKIGFSKLETEFHVSLGVGVAGINDFPDYSKSGKWTKPWTNKDSKQVVSFFNARYNWISSWKGDDSALKVDYVKVYSISKESDLYPNYEESKGVQKEQVPVQFRDSHTIVNGREICFKGALIFEDLFNNLDNGKWVLERYNPAKGPNNEFNYYEKDTISVTQSNLIIKPQAKQNEDDVRGVLDLKEGCTSPFTEDECHFQSQHYQNCYSKLLPPVKSGRITSRSTFKYVKIEVRAKLPVGDWLYTEIGLVPKDKKNRATKIWVAYARGNENLKASNGNELGGRVLYCGPIIDSNTENEGRRKLAKKMGSVPYSSDFHTYSLIWLPNEITCSVDDILVGKITTSGFEDLNTEFHISVGIGVGGENDFPDDRDLSVEKPWGNRYTNMVETFFEARNLWRSTWKGDDYALKVDSIKIYSV